MNRRAYLANLTAVTLLAGCSGSSDPGSEPTDQSTSEPTDQSTSELTDQSTTTSPTETENEPDPTPTDDPTTTSEPTTTGIPEPDVIELSGTGQRVTDTIPIQGGFTAFHLAHNGERNFIVELQDASTAEMIDLLANEIGTWQGNVATGLPSGEYILAITADGNWSAEIVQPRPNEDDVHSLPAEFSDSFPTYAGPLYFSGGTRITGTYSGSSNFIVEILNAQGELVDLAFNEIGTFQGETTFAGEGYGWVQVSATGDWQVDLQEL